jgi:predicted AlkP superfamily pyrophosphatase or phosphodiesterase
VSRFLNFMAWICLLLASFSAMRRFARAQTNKDRIVVVISLDGFPAYALHDPRLPIPTLRKLARQGAAADSMLPVNPTVTWPNHTTIVTGVDASEHGVLFNGLLIGAETSFPPTIEPWRDKDVLVHVPTIYDIAHDSGLTTAEVNWVAIYNANTIDWKFPELPDPKGEVEQTLVADGTVTAEQLKTFEDGSQAWQDEIWTDAAVKILVDHRPNLLLFHLLSLDNANHQYGAMSQASLTAMAYLDSQVDRIVQVLQRPDFAERSTLIVVSDHGFRNYRHAIHANALLLEKGILKSVNGKLKGDAWIVPEGGVAMVYVTNSARKTDLIAQLKSVYGRAEGIERVYGVEDFGALGLPGPKDSDQAPDIVLAAKEGCFFSGEPDKNLISDAVGGTHGFPNSDSQMQAIFLAWGKGVPSGTQLGRITNRDVAPTIAKLLGIDLKSARGHAIPGIGK